MARSFLKRWIYAFSLVPLTLSHAADPAKPALNVPEAIAQRLAPQNFRPETAQVAQIIEPVEASIAAGGKRLRPILCYLAGGVAGIDPDRTAPMACIAEWAHTASLMHDDIIDQSHERRGRPATWRLVGTKKAILLGDWLLSRLVRLSLEAGSPEAGTGMLEVIEGMVEGEFLQDSLLQRGNYSASDWDQVAFLKTGLLFQWALRSPLLLEKRDNDPLLRRFEAFGRQLGTTFQKRDDVEDAGEVGEINAVLLEAARLDSCSPLATCFTASSLRSAKATIRQEIHLEVEILSSQLIDIAEIGQARSRKEEWHPDRVQFQTSCLSTLQQIAQMLRISPDGD